MCESETGHVGFQTGRGTSPALVSLLAAVFQARGQGIVIGESSRLAACMNRASLPVWFANAMTIEDSIPRLRECARRMNETYGRVVFDEWAVVSLLPDRSRLLDYTGSRREEFAVHFNRDLAALRQSLLKGKHHFGDFEFAHGGKGSDFDAFMCLGDGVYLICNNLYTTMAEITKDERWLLAQRAFVELSEHVSSHPVTFTA